METRKEAHPTPRQLAAFALGKLTPESRGRMQEHLAGCATCSTFLSKTPRDTLVTLLRQAAAGIPASEQSTPGVRDSSTISGLPQGGRPPAPSEPAARPVVKGPAGGAQSRPAPAKKSPVLDDIPQPLREQTKYRIIRLIGRGGMGLVYEAYHERMDRRVALKIIDSPLLKHPEALRRFDQEVKAAANFDHPNLARAYDADEFGSIHVLVMEFVAGRSLDKVLAKSGPMSVRQGCDCIYQAASGLQHALERGMVHRDLKPQNLMLTPEGRVKILDFGLAKLNRERRPGEGLTRENALMGTPHYLAPEQALDAAKADIRADIYSLGCTLYCLLAGSPPFDGDTEMKVLLAHQHDVPRPLSEVRADVPQALSDLVVRMLAKNPADRPQTPAEVGQTLLPFAKGSAPAAPPAVTNVAPPAPPTNLVEIPLGDDAAQRRGSKCRSPARDAGTLAPATQAWRRIPPAWRLPSFIGLLSLALLSWVWGIGMLVRTPTGTILIQAVPEGVEVLVDDGAVTLKRDRNKVTIEAVPQGEHTLKITRDGRSIWTMKATIAFAGDQVKTSYSPPFAFEESTAKKVRKPWPSDPASGYEPPKEFRGSVFKVFPQQMNWHQARSRCAAMGGHLATVNDYAHNQFLTDLVRAAGKETAWLGATDEVDEGHWLWVNGLKMDNYTNWDTASLQPDNKRGDEHYLMLRVVGDGKWCDQPAISTHEQPGFVCQWD